MGKGTNVQYSQEWVDFFDQLQSLGVKQKNKKINFFSITQMLTLETKHSAFLAWLLKPDECHYLRNEVLTKFFEKVWDFDYKPKTPLQEFRSNKAIISNKTETEFSSLPTNEKDGLRENFLDQLKNVEGVEVETEDVTDCNTKGKDQKRMDIRIHIPASKTVVVIENKMFTKTHDDQLKNYETHVDSKYKNYNKLFVYLTPGGKEDVDYLPLNNDGTYNERWCILTYTDIKAIMLDVCQNIDKYSTAASKEKGKLKNVLEDYIEMIDTEILKNSPSFFSDCDKFLGDNNNCKNLDALFDYYKKYARIENVIDYCYKYYTEIASYKNDLVIGAKSAKSFAVYTKGIYSKILTDVNTKDCAEWFCKLDNGGGATISGKIIIIQRKSRRKKLSSLQIKYLQQQLNISNPSKTSSGEKNYTIKDSINISTDKDRKKEFTDAMKNAINQKLDDYYKKLKDFENELANL